MGGGKDSNAVRLDLHTRYDKASRHRWQVTARYRHRVTSRWSHRYVGEPSLDSFCTDSAGEPTLDTLRNCGRLFSPSRRGPIGSASGIGNGEYSHAAVCWIGRVAER